tara:strand:+ start:9675 stop:10685 length:1011 start_codon:yes stop_codon:yes gene_type:complete
MIRSVWNDKQNSEQLFDRFERLKSNGIGSVWIDHVNYTRKAIWVCVGKNKVVAYDDYASHGMNIGTPSVELTKDSIIIHDRSFFSQSACLLGIPFNNVVKLHSRWSRWTRPIDSDMNDTSVEGQDWLTDKNHTKEIPVGKGWYHYEDGMPTKHLPLKFNWDYELIDFKLPKNFKNSAKEWLEARRIQRNTSSRARYANRKAEERVDNGIYEMDDIFKLNNVSIRRILIQHFGMDTVLNTLDSEILDIDTIDKRAYELVKVSIPDSNSDSGFRDGNYLRMINPSTGETHFEGVPNHRPEGRTGWMGREVLDEPTVKCALAWRDSDANQKYVEPIVLT